MTSFGRAVFFLFYPLFVLKMCEIPRKDVFFDTPLFPNPMSVGKEIIETFSKQVNLRNSLKLIKEASFAIY